MLQDVFINVISGLAAAGVTGVVSFLWGRLVGRQSVHDQYYLTARDDLKHLIVDIANVPNRVANGAKGFRQKHKQRMHALNQKFWRKNRKILQFFLHTHFSEAEKKRSEFETALLNLQNVLLPADGPNPDYLRAANRLFQDEVLPAWNGLFLACFPAAPLREHEEKRVRDANTMKIGKNHMVRYFKP